LYEVLFGFLPKALAGLTGKATDAAVLHAFAAWEDDNIRGLMARRAIAAECAKPEALAALLVDMLQTDPEKRPCVGTALISIQLACRVYPVSGNEERYEAHLESVRGRVLRRLRGEDADVSLSQWFNIHRPSVDGHLCCCPAFAPQSEDAWRCQLFHVRSLGAPPNCANAAADLPRAAELTAGGCITGMLGVFGD